MTKVAGMLEGDSSLCIERNGIGIIEQAAIDRAGKLLSAHRLQWRRNKMSTELMKFLPTYCIKAHALCMTTSI